MSVVQLFNRFVAVWFLALLTSAAAMAQPVFNSSVSPTTIGAGNVATLTYTIDNSGSGTAALDAAFATNLPAGLTFRGEPEADASCVGAVVSAPSGGTALSFSDADIAAGSTCTLTVGVAATASGTITSGDLTSSLGNSGPASTTLTVDANAVTFDKSFSPSTVSLGGKSTVIFTITNPSASTRIGNLDFTDNLPAGLEVASPANATTNCVSAGINDTTVTATPGSSTISLDANGFAGAAGFEVLPVSSSCTVTVDVKATAGGDLVNSVELQADFVTVGSAQDTLSVTVAALNLTKDYLINPANAGGTTELEFTIANFNRFEGATDVSFTDDLSVGLAGLTYDSLLSNTCGGTVSGTGTSLISFANGTVSGGDTCAIRVLVSVPGGAVGGSYPNTTSMVAGTVGGVAVTGNAASDSLIVPAGGSAPTLTFEILEDGTFAADPVISAGDDIVLRYTITNTSTTDAASDIAVLLDPIPPLPFPLTATLPATPCGAGSSVAVVSTGFDDQGIELTGGSLAVGASCTFDVTLTTPGDLGGGTYTLVTDAVTATLAGSTVTGNSGSDSFVVGAGADVSFSKTFSGGVEPGGSVTLTFDIISGPESASVSALSFTDDLSAMLTGVTATGLPISACGGTLTGSAGDTLLTFTGGSLAGLGDSCAIPVTLNVPASAAIGDYPNTTSVLSGTASGQSFDFGVATDDLSVVGLNFTKEFLTNPVIAGETTTLRFSIENLHPTDDATITFFTDNLQANLSGLAATGPASLDTCGGALSGTTFLIYTGGGVLSGQTCTIEVEVLVPAAAADGSYANITSSLTSSFGTSDPAADALIVQSNLISLSKDFTDDPVAPGDAVTLQFTLTNEDPSRAASDIAFTDDLDAMLSGTTFDSVLSNTCGGTITGTATDTIDVSGVALAGGASCTLTTSLTVPGAAGLGPVDNTTSDVTATIDGLAVAGDAASDTLSVAGAVDLTFSKSFADAGVPAGGSTVLSLTVVNAGSGSVSGISFTDDLDAMLSGTVASGHAASAGCGGGGTFSGSGFLTASGYSVGVGETCTLTATVTVPGGAALGSYTNTTSQLFISGVPTEAAVSDSLVVVPAPTFDKSFADAAIALGFSTTMTLTVDNSASIIAANSLDVTDNLPAGMVVAATPNASATCTGGTLTATAGSGTVSYTGGTVAAAATCTVSVDVTAAAAGTLVNTTGDLTSSLGNSGNASDSLTVVPQPGFAKAFSPAGINLGQSSTLTFTIDNSGSVLAASALDFTDTLPANLAVAATPNASTTCTGGTLTATGGTGTVSYTGGGLAAASSCTISVDVTPTATGALNNLSGDLTSSLGNSGTASATLTVISPEIDISGSIGGAVADGGTLDQGTPDAGAQQTLTLTISNTGSDVLTLAAAPVISGASNVVVDSVTGPLVTSVAIGGSTTVTILYTPAAGILTDPTISLPFSFDVSLGNNDVDEAPYDFTVSGTAQDVTVPSGYTVAFDQDPVNAANETAVSFTFAGAEVGTGYAYSIASDGGGAPVTGSGTIATATDVVSGLDVSGLGDGTLTLTVALTDAAGNTGADATDTATKDATVPAGYSVAFDQDPVNAANETAVSFTFAGAEVGTGYAYSIASDGGGAPVTGSGTIATATDVVSGLDVSGLGDGTLTLTVALTDAAGNTGADATDTTTKDATVPAGYTVAFDQDPVNAANETAVSFTFAGAEVGTGYAYSIASDGGGAPVTGSGTIATATDVVSGLDVSGLGDGTLTLTVALTDAAGNTGADATDTTTKDATVPAGYTVAFDQDPVNAANETAVSFTFAGAEVGTGYAYSIASDGGGAPVTGSGTIATAADQITGIDVSGLGDGTLTLTVTLTDTSGNTGADATDTTTKDATVPAGYSVAFDQDPVNAANETAVSFTFAGAEVGTGYAYSIASDGGGAPVTGSGTIATAADQITGIDVSGLGDGTLTLTVTLTDTSGNTGADATDTTTKDATVPAGYSVAFDQDPVNAANQTAMSFTFAGAEVGSTYVYSIASDGGGAPVTGSGTIATITDVVSGLDLSGLGDGTLTLTVALTDAAGNTGVDATDTVAKDVVAPALSIDTPIAGDGLISTAEASAVILTGTATDLADGATVNVAVADGAAGSVTGTAAVSGGIWTTTLNLSTLADGALGLTADAVDAAGNPAPQATASATLDTAVPTGYTVAFDQDPVNLSNQTAIGVTVSGAEVGATVALRISSDGGASIVTPATVSAATATVNVTGLDLSSLADGTLTVTAILTDPAGNAGSAVTGTATKDTVAPSLAIDSPLAGDDVINAAEATAVTISGTATGLADGTLVTVNVTDSGAGLATGTASVAGGVWTLSLDVTGLADGALSLTADASDAGGNPAPQATATATKDADIPVVTIDGPIAGDDVINGAEAASFAVSGTATGVVDGTIVRLTLRDTSSTAVYYREATVSAGSWSLDFDIAALADGSYDLSADVTDLAGNPAVQATTSLTKDTTAPTIEILDPAAGANAFFANAVNAAEAAAFAANGSALNAADATQVALTATSVGGGSVSTTTTVTFDRFDPGPSGPIPVHVWASALDLSTLGDGAVTLTAVITDAAGNSASTSTSFLKDTTAPAGYSATLDQDPVNIANQTAASFTFADAEVGPGAPGTEVTFAYSITSDGGGAPVTGTGTIATATDQVTGIDLSGLPDGILTLSVALTDFKGNTGSDATDTTTKDATAPGLAFDAPLAGDDVVNGAEAASTVISGISTDLLDGATVNVSVSDGAAGLATGVATVSGGVWSVTIDLTSLADGALGLTADASDAAGNPAPQATGTLSKDVVAPSGYSATLDQDPVNGGNQAAVSFTFEGAEVGASFAYTITSDGGGTPVTGAGTIASATDQISGLDLTPLSDGTVTLTVALTDPAGNTGVDATDAALKDVAVPTATLLGPVAPQSDPFAVTLTFSEVVTGLDLTSVALVNGTASALTGSGANYSFTVTPDHDGTVEIALNAGAAADVVGNLSTAATAITVTADLTGTPNPTPLPDADGDFVPDILETGDRDGDGIPDDEDFDPQGYFYCEDDGRIIPGGGFTVSGPSGSNASLGTLNDINITRDGSTGEIQWFALRPGTYSMSLSYPTAVGIPSTARLSSGTLDLTTLLPANPAVIGSSEFGATGFLTDGSLGANPAFYTGFVIEAGDPFVLSNNIPMTQCAENLVTVTASTDGAEANGGAVTDASFTVTQGRVSTVDTVISYTVAGSATSGADFTALSGTVTIPAGATSATITVPVLEDGDIEGPETVEITLTGVTAGDLTTLLGTTVTRSATIADDDFADIAVVNVDLVTNEGGGDDATMTFALLGSPTSPVTLSFAGDNQCTVAPASITFTAADYTVPQALTIRAIDDDKVEGTHSCQPTVVVGSADTRYDGAPLALATVTVTDDLVDQIREPLTEILEDDLKETITTQTKAFSRMAKGALQRLQAGRDLPCGTIEGFDVDGSVQIQDATGAARGTFGRDAYNCVTDTREIIDGTFSLNKTEDTGMQALLQFAWQRERFVSDEALSGYFLGGYYSRTDVSGLGDGSIDGFGVNGGLYGARSFAQGLFLDYYVAGAAGRHKFDIDFDAAAAPINATGQYSYLAGFAGVGISGERAFDSFVMKPRVGLDLSYAKAGDADVTATQLGLSHDGVIDLDDFSGVRATAEIRFESLASPGGAEALAGMMRTAFTPRFVCELSSYDDDTNCGVGLAFAWERTDAASGLTWGLEVDVEQIDDNRRFTFNIKRERPIANGRGAIVTRLSMPEVETLQLEHGLKLDF